MPFAVQGRCATDATDATGVRHIWGCNDETNTPAAPFCARCLPAAVDDCAAHCHADQQHKCGFHAWRHRTFHGSLTRAPF